MWCGREREGSEIGVVLPVYAERIASNRPS